MPIYEYQCPTCGQIKEVIQKHHNDEPPRCSGESCVGALGIMHKLLSRGGTFILKGGGWYRDGYVKKEKK
jgi:putative FmdB family regulatory protein